MVNFIQPMQRCEGAAIMFWGTRSGVHSFMQEKQCHILLVKGDGVEDMDKSQYMHGQDCTKCHAGYLLSLNYAGIHPFLCGEFVRGVFLHLFK